MKVFNWGLNFLGQFNLSQSHQFIEAGVFHLVPKERILILKQFSEDKKDYLVFLQFEEEKKKEG